MYNKNITLSLKATANSNSETLTIKTYEWTINDIIQQNNIDTILLSTNILKSTPENNTIKLRVQNSEPCNKWSEYIIKTIEVSNMEQTFTVVVDKENVSTEVIINMTGTVTVTVKNQTGTPIPNAIVTIDTISATTNSYGIAILQNIPHGTKIGTVTL